MNILVLNGSPRPHGNTVQMIEAFREGASAKHNVRVFDVCRMSIAGCLACEYCHTKGEGNCVRKDDMEQIREALADTDMLVLASPIYYHNISGQLKCAVDRFYAFLSPDKKGRLAKMAMFLASGDPDMYEGAVFSYNGDFLDYLKLEGMGVFTLNGDISEEKKEELRNFGSSL